MSNAHPPIPEASVLTSYPDAVHLLHEMIVNTASAQGWNVFQALVYHIAMTLQVPYALATRIIHSAEQVSQTQVQTLAFWAGSGFGKNFTYALAGAPCELVFATHRAQCFPDQVQALFPADRDLERINAQSYLAVPLIRAKMSLIGHIAVLDTVPLTDYNSKLAHLEQFAALIQYLGPEQLAADAVTITQES